jgi:hypothetical protein
MSLPDDQLADLRHRGEAHERRINILRNAIRRAEQELAVHEVLLGLARNTTLIAELGKLHADSSQCATFAHDPVGYCAKRGIALPPEFTLLPAEGKPSSMTLNASVRVGDFEVQVVWDPQTGFDARPLTGFSRDAARSFYTIA